MKTIRLMHMGAGSLGPLWSMSAQAQQAYGDCSGPMHMWGGWGFAWIFPPLMLFIVIFCVAIFFLGHRLGGGRHHWGTWDAAGRSQGAGAHWGDPAYSALQILNERFAKGEIQKQEYEEKKSALLSGNK